MTKYFILLFTLPLWCLFAPDIIYRLFRQFYCCIIRIRNKERIFDCLAFDDISVAELIFLVLLAFSLVLVLYS